MSKREQLDPSCCPRHELKKADVCTGREALRKAPATAGVETLPLESTWAAHCNKMREA